MTKKLDESGLIFEIKRLLHDAAGPRKYFCDLVVDKTIAKLGIAEDHAAIEKLKKDAFAKGFPLRNIQPYILDKFKGYNVEGKIPAWVDFYAEKVGEIETIRFTTPIKQQMTWFLLNRGIVIESDPTLAKIGPLQEHFADAYHYAVQRSEGKEDPIDAMRSRASVDTWDFEVDTFESVDAQEVVPVNIRAAGALYYIYYLGERMGIFKLIDVLVLNWSSGVIDVIDGPGGDKLFRYYKMRDERLTAEERGMVYKRVLDLGSGQVLSRMAVNEYFQGLWQRLMTEVTEYIKKREQSRGTTGYYTPVSRKPVELATRELQYNLSEYAIGMTHMQVREMYSQLQEAIELLRDDQILDHFGGKRRKNMWKAIEMIAKQEFGRAPNVGILRTLAVEGYKVFQWISKLGVTADINEEAEFQDFLDAAEAWIIAAGSNGEGLVEEEPEEEDEFEEFEEEDEFEEFDNNEESKLVS